MALYWSAAQGYILTAVSLFSESLPWNSLIGAAKKRWLDLKEVKTPLEYITDPLEAEHCDSSFVFPLHWMFPQERPQLHLDCASPTRGMKPHPQELGFAQATQFWHKPRSRVRKEKGGVYKPCSSSQCSSESPSDTRGAPRLGAEGWHTRVVAAPAVQRARPSAPQPHWWTQDRGNSQRMGSSAGLGTDAVCARYHDRAGNGVFHNRPDADRKIHCFLHTYQRTHWKFLPNCF